MQAKLGELLQPIVDDGWARSLMVGVLTPNGEHYQGFGRATEETDEPPDADTVFEIGSVTKVFTCILLAQMASPGEVALDDPVGKHLSEGMVVPRVGGRAIVLEDLASHTSGLPNIPRNFWQEGDNIFDNNTAGKRWSEYSEGQLRKFLAKPAPPIDENRPYLYSNLGVGLLGHALENVAGEPLGDLLAHRICEPLGMTNTSFLIEPTNPGHDADGRPVNFWRAGSSVLTGAFALRSTCRDMLRFAHANLNPVDTPLEMVLKEAMKPRADINEVERTALGWKVNKFGAIYTTGVTGGFRCSLFLHPQTGTAVVLMANTQVGGGTGNRALLFDGLAGSVLNVALGVPPLPIGLPSPVGTPADQRGDYVGHYTPENGSQDPSFPVYVKEGALMLTGPGERELPLLQQKKDVFFVRAHDGTLTFLRDKSGTVTGMDLTFEGREVRLKRKPLNGQ